MKHPALHVVSLLLVLALSSTAVQAGRADVVRVDRPTGDPTADVASIEAAIAAAAPGDTIRFRRGTYQVFQDTQFVVTTPGVTLKGARKGRTTIRGVKSDDVVPDFLLGTIQLVGGNQTVKGLTFREFGTAISMGSPGSPVGGYVVEDCVFREGQFALELVGFSDDISTVEDNRFVDLLQAITVIGKTVHFRNNVIRAPRPETIPVLGQPFLVGQIFTAFLSGINICENNVLEDNLVVGWADGFEVVADFPEEICRNNVIRDNRFVDMKVFTSNDNGSMVWLFGSDVGTLEDNLVENNELDGSEGIGIVAQAASDNRIVDNEIEDLPGEKVPFSAVFGSALPGTGIFLDELSVGNSVDGNELEDVRNPILDLGDNFIGDNEIEDEDGRDEADTSVFPDAADSRSTIRDARQTSGTPPVRARGKGMYNETLNRRLR